MPYARKIRNDLTVERLSAATRRNVVVLTGEELATIGDLITSRLGQMICVDREDHRVAGQLIKIQRKLQAAVAE